MLTAKLKDVSISYERLGKGTPLVLVHGYPLDHSIWKPVVPLLEKKFDLILADLRGFGESGIGKKDYGMDELGEDVAGLLDHLHIHQAIVAGHSMGGYVALAFARAHPGRILGLGLISTQAQSDSSERQAGRYLEAKTILADGVGGVAEGMPTKLTANRALQAQLKELIQRQRPEGLAKALRAMADRPDSTALLPGFDFPVVIMHGLEDALMPIERARAVRAVVKVGHLVEIEGAGHMPMMEKPRKLAEGLKIFK